MGELFPGVTGSLTLARVIIRLGRADLKDIPKAQPLAPDLEMQLKKAISEVRRA